MRILVSALACNPAWGSEAAVGWSLVCSLAKKHEVWVLLHEHNRAIFDQTPGVVAPNIHLHFHGNCVPFHPNRLVARIESWRENFRWQRGLLGPARELHHKIGFDLAHHLTYATWRVASPLWQLGIPFIWGPLGGGEIFPWKMRELLSPTALAFEAARCVSNFSSRHNGAVRQCARHAAACIAGNRETFEVLTELRNSTRGVELLPGGPLAEKTIATFQTAISSKTTEGPLRLFAGGNLEGRKGVAIALTALAGLGKDCSYHYRLGGGGPELNHLQSLSASLGISENVTFGDSLGGEQYRQELLKSHIYLLPSLRDNAPRTLMEAMLAGCVPIVADCGGPASMVTEECGFKIPVGSLQEMAQGIASIITRLNADRSLLKRIGEAAHRRIVNHFSEQCFLESIDAIYTRAINGHPSSGAEFPQTAS